MELIRRYAGAFAIVATVLLVASVFVSTMAIRADIARLESERQQDHNDYDKILSTVSQTLTHIDEQVNTLKGRPRK